MGNAVFADTLRADARADRIDIRIARIYGDFGTGASLTGNRLDNDRTVLDFRHFELEKTLDKSRMLSRKHDGRAFGLALDDGDIDLDLLSLDIAFARNLFVLKERHFVFAKLKHRIAGHRIDTGNNSRDDLLFFVLVFAHHAVAFGLADALNNDLLCRLCRNTAEVLRLDLNFDDIADVVGLFDLARFLKRDLRFVVKTVLAANDSRLCTAVVIVEHIAVRCSVVNFDQAVGALIKVVEIIFSR